MKNTLISLAIAAMVAAAASSCQENNHMTYDLGNSGLDIAFADTTFSFTDYDDALVDTTIHLYVGLVGPPTAYDRPFILQVVDSKDAMPPSNTFEIGQTVIKAGNSYENIDVTLHKTAAMDTATYRLLLQIVPNQHFEEGNLRIANLSFGNQLMEPSIWQTNTGLGVTLQGRFGIWSKVKHELIVQATGQKRFYESLNSSQLSNYVSMAKNLLADINAERAARVPPLDPLTDETGRTVVIAANQ